MKNLESELKKDFEEFVSNSVGEKYKKGLFWKSKLRWELTKKWNGRFSKIGIPGLVREELGEEEATKLFQDTVDNIINNTKLLEKAISNWGKIIGH